MRQEKSYTMVVQFPKKGESRITNPMEMTTICLKLHGFNGKKKYFWHSVTLLKFIMLIGSTIYLFQHMSEPKIVTEIIATYPVSFMAVFKLFYLYLDRKRVAYFYKTIAEDFWDLHICGPRVEKQIKRRFSYTNVFIIIVSLAPTALVVMLLVFPLLEVPEGKRPLPNPIWTPFDTDPSPLYEFLYVIMLWNMFLSIFGNLFYDFIFVYGLQHLHVQFTLLKELLKNLSCDLMHGYSDLEKFHNELFQRKVMERLKICIEHHCKLISFGENLQKFTSKVLVPQLVMSFLALVFDGYILCVDHSDFTKTVMLASITGIFMIQLSIYGLQATSLREQSLSVLEAVIESEWHLFKAPIKRALTLFLLNSKKGITINAAGLTEVDNQLLVLVIKNVFSAITLLRAILSEEEKN